MNIYKLTTNNYNNNNNKGNVLVAKLEKRQLWHTRTHAYKNMHAYLPTYRQHYQAAGMSINRATHKIPQKHESIQQ